MAKKKVQNTEAKLFPVWQRQWLNSGQERREKMMDNETRDKIRRLSERVEELEEDRNLFLEIFEDLGVDVDRYRNEK